MRLTYALGPQRLLNGRVEVTTGGYFDGRLTSVDLSRGRVDLFPRLSVEPSFSLNWIDLPAGSFRTDLLRARVNYTFSPRMFFSSLLQYNSTNRALGANLRLRWEVLARQRAVRGLYRRAGRGPRCGPCAAASSPTGPFVVKFNRLFRF